MLRLWFADRNLKNRQAARQSRREFGGAERPVHNFEDAAAINASAPLSSAEALANRIGTSGTIRCGLVTGIGIERRRWQVPGSCPHAWTGIVKPAGSRMRTNQPLGVAPTSAGSFPPFSRPATIVTGIVTPSSWNARSITLLSSTQGIEAWLRDSEIYRARVRT